MTSQDNSQNDTQELREVYDCSFCEGEQKLWNLKTEEYIPCTCIEKLEAISTLIAQREQVAELRGRIDELYRTRDFDVSTPVHNLLIDRIRELKQATKPEKGV